MDVYRKNLVTIAVTIVTVFFPPPVNAAGCPSSECHYLPANLSPHVVCDVSQYGGTPPCYGEWSSIVNCGCDEDGFKISETGRTYWCQNGGWNPDVHNVKCTGPCTIDVGENVIVKDSTGRPTIITADTVESGENVRLSCPEGYGADGTATWTCHDGEWDGGSIESFKCLSSCYFPDNARSTRNKVEPIPHGDTVILQCDDGYEPRDTVTAHCQDGILNPGLACTLST